MSILYSLKSEISFVYDLAKKAGIQCDVGGTGGSTSTMTIQETDPQHDAFLDLFSRHPDFAVFYGSKSNKSQVVCRPHIRRLPNPKPGVAMASASSRTGTYMAQYYQFPVSSGNPGPIIAVISLGGGYQLSDLQYYWKTVCNLTTVPSVVNVPIGQANVPAFSNSDMDTENTLDLELIGSVCPNCTLLFISAPNTNTGFLNAFLATIDGVTVSGVSYNPTLISCSWGAPELAFTNSQLQAFNSAFLEATKKNITICAASGDSGCSDGWSNNTPMVDFPASSPYVIACGGTSIQSTTQETAWSWSPTYQWGCGSGASSTFAMPSWQTSLAKFPTGITPSLTQLENKRVVPDISLNADPLSGYTIYMNQQLMTNAIGGTSCCAPMMAGFLGLLKLNLSGLPLATYLYQAYSKNQSCFKDIVSGTNDNLQQSIGVWKCGSGFDYCCGLGSFNGTTLQTTLYSSMGGSNPAPTPTPVPPPPPQRPPPFKRRPWKWGAAMGLPITSSAITPTPILK